MSEKKRFINVTWEGRTLKLQTNDEGNLSLPLLRTYFPNAKGLTYTRIYQEYASTIISEECILNDKVDDYNVVGFSNPSTSSQTNNDEPGSKASRIKKIMEAMKTNKEKGKENKSYSANQGNEKAPPPKKAKFVPVKDRKLTIGWMHSETDTDRFSLIKSPMGGTKYLILNNTTEYTASNILDLAIAAYRKDNVFTEGLFKDCNLYLGLYNGTPLVHFLDEDGNACSIWKYCKSQGKPFYRLRLYLLSTLKKETNSGHLQEKKETDKQESEETEEKFGHVEDPETGKETEDERVSLVFNPEEQMQSPYESDEMLTSPYESDEMLTSLYDSDEMDEDSETDGKKMKNSVEVLYQRMTVSKYSKLPSVIELNRKDCYRHLKVEMRGTYINKEGFDPLHFGFFISRITMDEKVLLKISVNDDCTKSYEFPAVDLEFQVKHAILHRYHVLNGFCEQKYGFGVIPYCDDDCQPIFRWKKDGKTMKEGKFLYWYDDAQLTTNDGAGWSCEVICNHAYGN